MILLGLPRSSECNFANYITSLIFCSLVEIIVMLDLKGVNLMPNEQLQILSFRMILQNRMMIMNFISLIFVKNWLFSHKVFSMNSKKKENNVKMAYWKHHWWGRRLNYCRIYRLFINTLGYSSHCVCIDGFEKAVDGRLKMREDDDDGFLTTVFEYWKTLHTLSSFILETKRIAFFRENTHLVFTVGRKVNFSVIIRKSWE